MKFKETMLWAVVHIPVNTLRGDNLYSYALKMPYLIALMAIGIPIAIIFDFLFSFKNVKFN